MLFSLPAETLNCVMFELYNDNPMSLESFRLASKQAAEAAEPCFYRKIALRNEALHIEDELEAPAFLGQYNLIKSPLPNASLAVTQGIVLRLADTKDSISRYVRDLEIGPMTQELFSSISEETLVKVLRNLHHLEVFRWTTSNPIPLPVLHIFHDAWPRARLHATLLDRHPDQTLDTTLLNSPQLYTLSITVLSHEWLERVYTEYRRLTDIIMNSSGLRVLKLMNQNSQMAIADLDGKDTGPTRLWLEATANSLPALEELRIPGPSSYNLDTDYSICWKNRMNWQALQRLDVGHYAPHPFLKAITGEVPGLKVFSWGLQSIWGPRSQPWGTPVYANIVKTFFLSIQGLEEMCIRSWDNSGMMVPEPDNHNWHGYIRSSDELDNPTGVESLAEKPRLWLSILDQHGPTLRKLSISHETTWWGGWNEGMIWRLSNKAPRIEHLTLEVHFPPYDHNGGLREWSESCHLALASFMHLHTLIVYYRVGDDIYTEQEDFYITEFHEEIARNEVVKLLEVIQLHNPSSPMEKLVVVFANREKTNEWRFEARRIYDGTRRGSMVLGKMVMIGDLRSEDRSTSVQRSET
ncbi:hypothetical protein BT63DRAFT_425174 [Microthyrium microscopicum]|uniref:Uncharacterized protein n=1 Tax=Microthyrium microscopicum TaxID=703497 RepID=A0A6A6UDK1_9PEZI|nr:hypothetical protein BT63DRAFT_425174 [Microthyrium microscopicum]